MIYLLTYDGYMKEEKIQEIYAMRSKRLYIGIPQVL